jgi:hypothetical protein
MFYAYNHRTRWAASWDDIDEIERPSHFHQKTMFTVFFNGTGEYKITILPEGQKVNCAYFIEFLLRPSAEICYPQGMGRRGRSVMLHFDKRRFATLRDPKESGEFWIQKNGASALYSGFNTM